MNTLMLIKHIELRIVVALYYKSEYEAIRTWRYISFKKEWELIYLEKRRPTGHRYKLIYTKCEKQGNQISRDIICFSKKEARYLKNRIERINQNYIIQIKKLY